MNDSRLTRLPAGNGGPSCASCNGGLLTLSTLLNRHRDVSAWLERLSSAIPPLLLRLILAYEFGKAGLMKLRGENWFADVAFPFPFGLLSADVNWWLATGFEIVGPIALVLGWGTRFFSFALMVLTVVAISVAHWPSEWQTFSDLLAGYVISDRGHGNFKFPVLYLAMLNPLWFGGAGRWSLDHWLRVRNQREDRRQPMATVTGCTAGQHSHNQG